MGQEGEDLGEVGRLTSSPLFGTRRFGATSPRGGGSTPGRVSDPLSLPLAGPCAL